VQALGGADDDGAHLGRVVGLEQILVRPGIEGTVVVDQEINGVAQISWLPTKYWNQTAKLAGVGGICCLPMLRIAPSGDGHGIVVIGIVEA
jgi:hypothetical protein